MRTIFLRGVLGRALFDQRRSIGWWAVGIAGFVVVMVAYWPSIHDQGQDLQRVVNSMPAAMKAFTGDLSAFTSGSGYLQGEPPRAVHAALSRGRRHPVRFRKKIKDTYVPPPPCTESCGVAGNFVLRR